MNLYSKVHKVRWSGLVVSFLNSTTRTHGLCLRPDQTHGQNPYMSRLIGHVYDQTKSADLSETRADSTELCRRPGRRHGSPTKSGRVRVVEFGPYPASVIHRRSTFFLELPLGFFPLKLAFQNQQSIFST